VKKLLPIIAVVVLLMLFMAPAASAAPPAWGGDCGGAYHCVRWGETLYSIGRTYDVDPYYIAQVNGLRNPNHIYAGQILYIPSDGPSYPWYGHNRQDRCRDYDCGNDYGSRYDRGSRYGYDYTGYYYDGNYPNYQRYSYTCGYNYNCY
jgi:LysM repeat protein